MANFIRLILIILPWLSVFFLSKRSIKEYLPVSILGSFLVSALCLLAVPFKWWTVNGGWKFKLLNDISFIFGPFLVGTLWIFKFTFGNLKRYVIANLSMDLFFAFPLTYLFQRVKLFKLIKFTPNHIFLAFTSFSFLMYFFQIFYKKNIQLVKQEEV